MTRRTASNRDRTVQEALGIHKTTLSNGLRIMSEEVSDAKSFALGIWINAGTRDEETAQAGIAHFIEHAVFRRSSHRNSRQIASQFESLGAYINAFTSKEQTCYYVRALTAHFDRCMSLLADVVLNPVFRSSDIEKERTVILEELKSYEDEPEEYILDLAEKSLFGRHALGFPIAGNQQSVAALSVDDLRAFHGQHYTPQNMLVAVAGPMTHEQVLQSVNKHVKRDTTLGTSRRSMTTRRRTPRPTTPRRHSIERPFQQSHLLLARRTIGVRDALRWPISLLNTILGDGMSSRLHQRIRERRGLAYSLYSSLQLLTDCGIASIYAGTESATLSMTETLIDKELRDLRTNGVTRAELHRAKEQLKSSIIMGLESLSSRMHALAKAELEEGVIEDVSETLAAIDAVSMRDMQRAARTLCTPSAWTRVIIKGTADEH